MLTKVAAGLVGLGLIGGGGSATYGQHGNAAFSCPAGTSDKLKPYDIVLGRMHLTLQQLRRAERDIERQYPSHQAPVAVIRHYQMLQSRDDRLVTAYNREVDARNAIVARDCTPD